MDESVLVFVYFRNYLTKSRALHLFAPIISGRKEEEKAREAREFVQE